MQDKDTLKEYEQALAVDIASMMLRVVTLNESITCSCVRKLDASKDELQKYLDKPSLELEKGTRVLLTSELTTFDCFMAYNFDEVVIKASSDDGTTPRLQEFVIKEQYIDCEDIAKVRDAIAHHEEFICQCEDFAAQSDAIDKYNDHMSSKAIENG